MFHRLVTGFNENLDCYFARIYAVTGYGDTQDEAVERLKGMLGLRVDSIYAYLKPAPKTTAIVGDWAYERAGKVKHVNPLVVYDSSPAQ